MPKLIRSLMLLGWLSTCLMGSAWSQQYRFAVPEMEMQAYVQPDASIRLEYRIEFQNMQGAHAIDIVDIGLPHRNFDLTKMSASIDGVPLTKILKSTQIDIGVEVHLESREIPAGKVGEFRFACTMPDMVYQDTTDKSYASLQIVPTWFDPQLIVDRTQLKVAVHLLPQVEPDQVKYQNESFKYSRLVLFGDDPNKHVVALWQYDSWALSQNNPKISVSFPKTGMNRVVELGPLGLFMKWFRESPEVQFGSLAILGLLFAVIFFRFSHGTGFVLFAILAGVIALTALASPPLHLLAWPLMIGLFFINERTLGRRKQARTYLPAMATVEGGGIKRGLTAPQAAVLLETPMGRVLGLVIFGLIKKGVLERIADEPLEVAVASAFKVARKERLQQAGDKGLVIHDYEHSFVDRLMAHHGSVKDCDFSEAVGGLIKSVASRMAGFDLSETKKYYQAIIQRALKEASSVGDLPERDKTVDKNFEWILLDDTWIDLFDTWARHGRPYRPWWQRSGSDTVIINQGSGGSWLGGDSNNKGAPTTSRTSLGEVASSFAGWTENTMGSLASAIEPAKMGLDIPAGQGILDLSGIDRVTADVFKALAEAAASGSSGGSGGSGCACACAGCACACACAGGGR